MIQLRLPVALAVAIVTAPAFVAPAKATEIKVINANALTLAMKEIAASFTKETGNTVTFVGLTPGIVENRIKASETYDIVINPAASLAAFDKEGKLRAGSRRPFARVGIGVAIREGNKIDLSTVESTKKAFLDAKSIAISETRNGGLSGINAVKVVANLGLTEAIKAKTQYIADGQERIGKGEIDFGLYNLSEIPRAPNVVRAGPVPAAVQVYISYDAAIPATNTSPEAALALLKYLSSPKTHPVWDKAGLEVVPE
jgi:molybdate transport system substrate-binding protein